MRRDPCNSNNSYARYVAPVGRRHCRQRHAGSVRRGPVVVDVDPGRRTRLAHVIDVFSATVASYILITLDWPLRASGALAPGSRPATIYRHWSAIRMHALSIGASTAHHPLDLKRHTAGRGDGARAHTSVLRAVSESVAGALTC